MSVPESRSQDRCALYRKLNAVGAKVRSIRKGGFAQMRGEGGYKFAKDEDITPTLLDAARDEGLCVTFDVVEIGYEHIPRYGNNGSAMSPMRAAHCQTIITVTDIETGATHTARFPGYGENVGDKAIYVAMTGSKKYALLETFGVATGDDPERTQQPQQQQAPQAQQAQRQRPPVPSNGVTAPSGQAGSMTQQQRDTIQKIGRIAKERGLPPEEVNAIFLRAHQEVAKGVRNADLSERDAGRIITLFQQYLAEQPMPTAQV